MGRNFEEPLLWAGCPAAWAGSPCGTLVAKAVARVAVS